MATVVASAGGEPCAVPCFSCFTARWRGVRRPNLTTALECFYRHYDQIDHPPRALKYERAMEQLHARYPDDREATVFYSLALLGAAISLPPDKTYARQRKAGAMLEAVFTAEPNHP